MVDIPGSAITLILFEFLSTPDRAQLLDEFGTVSSIKAEGEDLSETFRKVHQHNSVDHAVAFSRRRYIFGVKCGCRAPRDTSHSNDQAIIIREVGCRLRSQTIEMGREPTVKRAFLNGSPQDESTESNH